MTVNGKTEDGKLVIGNVFRMHETRGVPLDTIIQEFDRLGYVIDWIDFYESSVKSGWNIKTTLKKIQYSLVDIKGKEYCNNLLQRLKLYIIKTHGESLWD